MGEWLTPGWEATGREYRERLAQIEATERRLKNNPAALREFHNDQQRLFNENKRAYQAAHPGSGCFGLIGLVTLGVLALSRVVRRR